MKNIQQKFVVRTTLATLATSCLLFVVSVLFVSNPAHAATPVDACFTTSPVAGGVSITSYEGPGRANNCPADVDIPSAIAGQAVKQIGEQSLNYRSLTSVTIPAGVISIGNNALSENQLTSIIIPDSVTSIGLAAFKSNQLTSVVLGNGVVTIDDYAFSTNQLTGINIPSTVTSLGRSVFEANHFSSLPAYFSSSTVAAIPVGTFSSNLFTTLTIPANITTIEAGAFSANQLVSADIPATVTSFGTGVFDGNRFTSLPSYFSLSAVTNIPDQTFSENQFTSLAIPANITTIGAGAFSLNFITNLVVPGTVDAIKPGAFAENRLQQLILQEGVHTIGTNAFAFNLLRSVQLPASFTGIEADTGSCYDMTCSPFDAQGNGAREFHENIAFRTYFYTMYQADSAPYFDGLKSDSWLPAVYTAGGTNPLGLTDHLGIGVIFDFDTGALDGQNVVGGGYLINPAQTTITYKAKDGTVLRPNVSSVGKDSNGNDITDYTLQHVPVGALTVPADLANPTQAEILANQQVLSGLFYKAGQTKSFTPPAIAGYLTPAAVTRTLVPGQNTIEFVYEPQILQVDFAGQAAPSGVITKLMTASQLSIPSTGDCSTIQSSTMLSGNTVTQPANTTILGGIAFTLNCTSGGSTTVTYKLGAVVSDVSKLRVYKAKTGQKTLTEITDKVSIRLTNGVTAITYDLLDGSNLDEDGTVNGIIKDPIYVGLDNSATELAATGDNLRLLIVGSSVVVLGGIALVWRRIKTIK